jgi:hypothetical protein
MKSKIKTAEKNKKTRPTDVASATNVNVFIQDLIVAYDEGAIGNDCFKVESLRMDHPPGSPNQGPWMAHTLYVSYHQALSALGIYLRKGNLSLPLRAKDLRDQLSRNDFFVKLGKENNYQISKKFGAAGKQANHSAWGFLVDKHPLGYRQVSDEVLQAALLPERDKKRLGRCFENRAATRARVRYSPLWTAGWRQRKRRSERIRDSVLPVGHEANAAWQRKWLQPVTLDFDRLQPFRAHVVDAFKLSVLTS